MAEVGIVTAFLFGILSFVSPCVLPLLPGYLSLMSGYSVGQLQAEEGSALRMLEVTLLFVAGFTAVFVSLGAGATALGGVLRGNRGLLESVAGWAVLGFGLLMLWGAVVDSPGLFDRTVRLDIRPSRWGRWAPVVMGLAFGFAWTPCIGPVLAAILTLASVQTTVGQGVVLLFAFSLGLGVPFVLAGLGMSRAMGMVRRLRRHLRALHALSGALLAAFGVVMITGQTVVLASWLQRIFTRLGLDWLATI